MSSSDPKDREIAALTAQVAAQSKTIGELYRVRRTIEMTRTMHHAFGHPVEPSPTIPTKEVRRLRLALILEELQELAEASGFSIPADIIEVEGAEPDLIAAADALGDLDVVLTGSFLCWGMPQAELAAEILYSNMSKLGRDGKPVLREDGKFLKGPDYFPPNIAAALARAAR